MERSALPSGADCLTSDSALRACPQMAPVGWGRIVIARDGCEWSVWLDELAPDPGPCPVLTYGGGVTYIEGVQQGRPLTPLPLLLPGFPGEVDGDPLPDYEDGHGRVEIVGGENAIGPTSIVAAARFTDDATGCEQTIQVWVDDVTAEEPTAFASINGGGWIPVDVQFNEGGGLHPPSNGPFAPSGGSPFDFSGGTFFFDITNDNGAPVHIVLDADYVDLAGLVAELNDQAGYAFAVNEAGFIGLEGSGLGCNTRLQITGLDKTGAVPIWMGGWANMDIAGSSDTSYTAVVEGVVDPDAEPLAPAWVCPPPPQAMAVTNGCGPLAVGNYFPAPDEGPEPLVVQSLPGDPTKDTPKTSYHVLAGQEASNDLSSVLWLNISRTDAVVDPGDTLSITIGNEGTPVVLDLTNLQVTLAAPAGTQFEDVTITQAGAATYDFQFISFD